jgi:GNAT superfamily N-acetyltransferase
MTTPAFEIRAFQKRDIPQLLELMKALAILEGYIDQFAVTARSLEDHGLGSNPRFGVLVAVASSGSLLGMAVHYTIPWTFDLKPTLILKELYVSDATRGSGVGQALIKALAQEAKRVGAPRIKWTVLDANVPAQKFYANLGGRCDQEWQSWYLDEAAIAALSA